MKLDVTSGKYEVVGILRGGAILFDGQGPRGCLGPMPVYYTRVSAFVQWIKENMKKADSFMQFYQGELLNFGKEV